ncbi:hypothetical protein NODU109028_14080 [Nocardioides dubius]
MVPAWVGDRVQGSRQPIRAAVGEQAADAGGAVALWLQGELLPFSGGAFLVGEAFAFHGFGDVGSDHIDDAFAHPAEVVGSELFGVLDKGPLGVTKHRGVEVIGQSVQGAGDLHGLGEVHAPFAQCGVQVHPPAVELACDPQLAGHGAVGLVRFVGEVVANVAGAVGVGHIERARQEPVVQLGEPGPQHRHPQQHGLLLRRRQVDRLSIEAGVERGLDRQRGLADRLLTQRQCVGRVELAGRTGWGSDAWHGCLRAAGVSGGSRAHESR